MQIDLDYYRILSVPIGANSEQIDRAYEDRLRQQSRREYSSMAIASRSKLLQQAYTILSDPETRSLYDVNFTAPIDIDPVEEKPLEIEFGSIEIPENPTAIGLYIEIEPESLIGALIILYELAEYEIIVNLATDYLATNTAPWQKQTQTNNSSETTSTLVTETEQEQDIILCLVLAYQELSREQWRRGEFEKAATSGQTGLNLLQQKAVHFLALQREMTSEYNSLKPYRVLELLKQNPSNSPLRAKGLELLQEMLRQRQGMEGANDPSGLNSDRFLCFIQQVRTYLTLQEQKEIFLAETERGSQPGSLVAAHALIAEGYAYKKPSSILQAQNIFKKLNNINNHHWERAICALLLGRTAQAQTEIEHSQETNTLELIKKRSLGAPDLLPGICFYGEQWLQQKVLSQFPNLKSHKITLEEYFDDPHVQAELDRISPVIPSSDRLTPPPTVAPKPTKPPKRLSWWNNKKAAPSPTGSTPPREIPSRSVPLNEAVAAASSSFDRTSLATASSSSVPTKNKLKPRRKKVVTKKNLRSKKGAKNPSSKKGLRNAIVLASLICGIGVLAFNFTKNRLESSPVAQSVTPSPDIEPTPVTPEVTPEEVTPEAATPEVIPEATTTEELNPELAREVVQKWLDSKAAALGEKRQTEQLDSILTGSLLTQWRDRSTLYQQSNIYRQFEHTLDIESVTIDEENPDLATVEAKVTEIAQHYQGGQIDLAQSYNDNLRVRYELVRQNDSWLIKGSEVLETL